MRDEKRAGICEQQSNASARNETKRNAKREDRRRSHEPTSTPSSRFIQPATGPMRPKLLTSGSPSASSASSSASASASPSISGSPSASRSETDGTSESFRVRAESVRPGTTVAAAVGEYDCALPLRCGGAGLDVRVGDGESCTRFPCGDGGRCGCSRSAAVD